MSYSKWGFGSLSLGPVRFRAKREHLKRLCGLQPESQEQNLAVTVLNVPPSFDCPESGASKLTSHFGLTSNMQAFCSNLRGQILIDK